MYVIFIHGPPAVGKYTIGKLVSDHLHMPLYHNHLAVDLATCLFDFGSEAFKLLRESIWLKSFELAAAHGQSFIFTFNPEATVAEDLIPRLMNLLRSNGGDVLFVELACAEETVLARLSESSRRQFGKLTDREVYMATRDAGGFKHRPLPEPLLRIDTDLMDARAAADLIIETVTATTDKIAFHRDRT